MSSRRDCPECGAQTQRSPSRDTRAILIYKCRKGHLLSVGKKGHDLVSVVIPFEPLKSCPECGRRGLKVDSERSFDSKDGISRLVVYRCPNGHTTPQRQLVVRQYNLPEWDGD